MSRAPLVFTIHFPRGMLAFGLTRKIFTSVDAFDGYVGALRRLGVTVAFQSPTVAIVSGAAA